MRKPAAVNALFPALLCIAALLWLVWAFLPLPVVVKSTLTLLVLACALWVTRRHYRYLRPAERQESESQYPPAEYRGPVLLVCGDIAAPMFATAAGRVTAQGCYLNVGSVNALTPLAERLLGRDPLMAGQLVAMFSCLPDMHQDEAQLRASLKALRHQLKQLSSLTGYPVPVVLSFVFAGPETPWVIVRGSPAVVCPKHAPALTLTEWQQTTGAATTLPLLQQAFSFVQQIIIDELAKADRLSPALQPFAVVLRSGCALQEANTLWSQWLHRHSCLWYPHTSVVHDARWYFADPLLPLLAPFATPLQGGRTGRRVVLILLFCAITALLYSVRNNTALIHQVSADLQRWSAIPMDHYAPKAQALAALQQDALQLEIWQRQGEPQRYSLGFYPGERLWLNVQQAIDTYVPPPPPPPNPKPPPTIIRLNSMSLFDSGKAELKTGSIKVLVNSLVGIKAKPGWLIVVSGHTDNTGSPALNQTLSLQRAVAVRDWMRDTGDVPESCFAVQGYGADRPVATNDTPDGRALNRRVEISLVPQADACQIPGKPPALSKDDGAVNN